MTDKEKWIGKKVDEASWYDLSTAEATLLLSEAYDAGWKAHTEKLEQELRTQQDIWLAEGASQERARVREWANQTLKEDTDWGVGFILGRDKTLLALLATVTDPELPANKDV